MSARIVVSALVFAIPAATAAAQGGDHARQPVAGLDRVALAVVPLPDTLRAGATVIDRATEAVVRRGSNGITCLTDDPSDHRVSLLCYPTAINGYMRRTRELGREGIRGREFRSITGSEVRSGKLFLPAGTMIRNLSGAIDSATGVPDSVRVWSEMLLPWADAGELGIPEFNAGLDPWMMSSGTVNAHVMIRYRSESWDDVIEGGDS